jgi:hypothetical protein
MNMTVEHLVTPSKKLGLRILCKIKTTGRRKYVQLPNDAAEVYGLRIGDTLRIELIEVFRTAKTAEDEEGQWG